MFNGKTYAAKVEEVHSGDDFILMVDLGVDGLFKRTRGRLHGVDAPNAYKARAETEAGAIRDEVKRLISAGKCMIELISEGKGGWIVRMFVTDPLNQVTDLNSLLRGRGYIYTPQQIQDGKHGN